MSSPLTILKYPNDFLRKKTKAVSKEDFDKAQEFAQEMFVTMKHAEGVGLAATQVGDDRQIIVIDINAEENNKVYFLANPKLVETSKETKTHEEGCLSIPGVTANVNRPDTITVQAIDLTTKEDITINTDGILAVCLQHEIDHLNGVLFIDHVSRLRRTIVLREYKKLQAENKKS